MEQVVTAGRCAIRIGRDMTAFMSGHETGRLSVVKVHGDVLVLHEQPSTHWVGRGLSRGYDPARFRVFRKLAAESNPSAFRTATDEQRRRWAAEGWAWYVEVVSFDGARSRSRS